MDAKDMAELQLCVDRVLPQDLQREASERARDEAERNVPDSSLLQDVLQRADIAHPEALVMLTGKKWRTGRTLNVYFMDGPEWARVKAFELLARWGKQANLKYQRTNDRAASQCRITFERGGSWSYLGTDNLAIPKDQPTLQLGWLVDGQRNIANDVEWQRTTVHEGGHFIDFVHEQAHPRRGFEFNRDAVIDKYSGPPNNWSVSTIERQVLYKYSELNTNFSEYDKGSIMHYPIPAALVMDPADAVGWNTSRSRLDKRTAALWYPKPSLQVVIDSAVEAFDKVA